MTEDQFSRQKAYEDALLTAERLLSEGLLTDGEMKRFKAYLIERHKPLIRH